MKLNILATAIIGAASAAQADIDVRFIEGAPKDRFEITSSDPCHTDAFVVEINLAPSAGGLIFDTTAQGAGVQVFQPFELTSGTDYVSQVPAVRDGDKRLSLQLNALPTGQVVAFTLDLDDTIGAREITVNGSEIAGAEVAVQIGPSRYWASFDESATARVGLPDCTS